MRIRPQYILLAAILLLVVGAVSVPAHTDAAGLVPCGSQGEPACEFCHLFQLGENVVNFFLFPSTDINGGFAVVPILATILFALGGLYLLLGPGSPSLYERGRKTLTSVVIGLIIIYTAWVLVNTFLVFVGVAKWTGLGSWWQIQCGI